MSKSLSGQPAKAVSFSTDADFFIPSRLDEPISQFSLETKRIARADALSIPRQLLLLQLLDQAYAVARGAACVLTLFAQSECDAQDDGAQALHATSVDNLRGLCQASLGLLADRIGSERSGKEARRQRSARD